MIGAFARAHQTFGREEDLTSAKRAADFLLATLFKDGKLLATWRDGKARLNAYLDDHAFLARGLLDLYEASFERKYLDAAGRLATAMLDRFEDKDRGGFFFTSHDHETLLARSRSLYDGALPAGAGVAVEVLLRLAVHRDDERLRAAAVRTLKTYRALAERSPSGFCSLLAAGDFAESAVLEIAVVGPLDDEATQALLRAVRGRYLPSRVVERARVKDLPLFAARPSPEAASYVAATTRAGSDERSGLSRRAWEPLSWPRPQILGASVGRTCSGSGLRPIEHLRERGQPRVRQLYHELQDRGCVPPVAYLADEWLSPDGQAAIECRSSRPPRLKAQFG
jgi:uncharacterized protein YyaL (SSP411 family)